MKHTAFFLWTFSLLRILLGWHLLYEGLVKLTTPGWSSAGYLKISDGWLSPLFHRIVENPLLLQWVDWLNMLGLTLAGLALMLGLAYRVAAIAGACMLLMYYLAEPSWMAMSAAGNSLWISKTFIEAVLLGVLAFVPGRYMFALDNLWGMKFRKQETSPVTVSEEDGNPRRKAIGQLMGLPFLGLFSYAYIQRQRKSSWEEKALGADGSSSATIKTFEWKDISELKEQVPHGKIKNLEVSRLIMGGNLIGGWAHARDLIYVSKLVKAYNSDEKVIETLSMAEACGINSLITNPQLNRIITKYWKQAGGKIQFISDCGIFNDLQKGIDTSLESGAHACYIQGEMADQMVRNGEYDAVASAVEYIRNQGLPAGIGAHELCTVEKCVELGIKPDFWVKTLHQHNYWSANPGGEEHDNIFCRHPNETIAYMNALTEPWIAFKVLAAGALEPKEGFPFAFNHGADFICVGMYDFQIVENSNLVADVLKNVNGRSRPWCA
jgi:uncharacterized membrane protein YphA (DoxX/SURF4 family)